MGPLPVENQVAVIYAGTNGYLDSIAVGDVRRYEEELYRFLETRHSSILTALADKKQLDDGLKTQLNAVLKEFGEQFAAAGKSAA